MSNAINQIGKLNFWKVSIKPGRPFGFGVLPKNKPALMIPGNPVASFTIFFLFGRYLVNYMLGNKNFCNTSFRVRSNFNMKKKERKRGICKSKSFLQEKYFIRQ